MKMKALYAVVGLSFTVAVWSCSSSDDGGDGGSGGSDAGIGGQMGGQGGVGGVGSGGSGGGHSGGSGGNASGGSGSGGAAGGSGGAAGGSAGAAAGSGGTVIVDAGGDANVGDAGSDAGSTVGDAGGDASTVSTNGDPGFYNFENSVQGWAPIRGPMDAVVKLSTAHVFAAGKGLSSLEYVVPAVTQAEIDAATPDDQGVRGIERGVGLGVPNIMYQTGTTKPIFAGKTMKVRVWFPADYNANYTTVFVLAPDPIVPGWWKNADFLAVTPGAWNEFTFPVPEGMNIGDQWYTFGVYMKFIAPWTGGSIFVDSVEF